MLRWVSDNTGIDTIREDCIYKQVKMLLLLLLRIKYGGKELNSLGTCMKAISVWIERVTIILNGAMRTNEDERKY